MTTMTAADKQAQQKAEEIFEGLSNFERNQLHVWGTAFTTFEDHGDDVCAWLRHIARRWMVSQERKAHRGES